MNEGIERFLSGNTYSFCTCRDNHVVRLIKDGRAFTRRQVEQILITNRKSSKRIAQRVLTRLYKQERINKKVYAPQIPAVYYVDKPKHMEHTLLINEVYCSLLSQKKSWHKIDWKWSYPVLDIAIADAMFTISTDKERVVVFLEVERNPSKRFDKDIKYESVFNADWVNEEWAVIKGNHAIFPTILIVTDDKLEVKSELNFIISSIDEVQKDIYGLLRR